MLAIVLVGLYSCNEPAENTDIDGIPELTQEGIVEINHESQEAHPHAVDIETFVNMPFTLSVQGSEEWGITTEVIPNLQNPERMDTVLTMKYKSSVIHVRNENFFDAHLVDPDIILVKEVTIGMSRLDFEERFVTFEENEDDPFVLITKDLVVMGCCKELKHHALWQFHFKNGVLDEIHYDRDFMQNLEDRKQQIEGEMNPA